MGGDAWFYVPKVWSPIGGWWVNPPNWKRNFAMVYTLNLFIMYNIYVFAEPKVVEYKLIPDLSEEDKKKLRLD